MGRCNIRDVVSINVVVVVGYIIRCRRRSPPARVWWSSLAVVILDCLVAGIGSLIAGSDNAEAPTAVPHRSPRDDMDAVANK